MSSHWVRLERVSWVRPTATTLVTAKRPYAARVARLFDLELTLWILPRPGGVGERDQHRRRKLP